MAPRPVAFFRLQSSISRRAKRVSVSYRPLGKGPMAHVVIDAGGLKVFGAGEWHQKTYGLEKRRSGRKLHMAVDVISHEIIAAQASVSSVADSEVLSTLINPLHRQLLQVSADGAYDTRSCYKALQRKGVKISIPPRKNGVLWEAGHPRNQAVNARREGQLVQWTIDSGYHQRSIAETAISRYKQCLSPRLSFRDYNAQVGEMLIGIKLLNKFTAIGMPAQSLDA